MCKGNFLNFVDRIPFNKLNKMLRYTASRTCSVSQFKMGLESIHQRITMYGPQRNMVSASLTNPDGLPHYPLPALQDTLQKFLRSVQPLLSTEAYRRTETIVTDFARSNGAGPHLHALLRKRADSTENWLSDWWLKYAYLGYRIPVVVYSNPGLYFDTKSFANETEWLQYTSKVLWAALSCKERISLKQLPADRMGKALLDMGQYGRIFGTCRIPAPEFDRIEYNPDAKYVIVAHRNAFFKVPVYDAAKPNRILSERELLAQLLEIVQNNRETSPPIGALTAQHRDALATAYERLISDETNRLSVECITKSLFIVCLDQAVPLPPGEELNVASNQLIHGGGAAFNSGNRWFDKTLQLISNENGLSGLNYEHSPGEGQPIAVLSDFIIKHTKSGESVESASSGSFEKPQKLQFRVCDALKPDIEAAIAHIDQLASNLQMSVVHFKSFGKNFIKSQKMSPDSFIQMAMQYAFYKYHGEPGAQYETAQQRLFIHGRTETIRSCSVESIAFAKAMCNTATSDADKVQALKLAVNGHQAYAKMAMNGSGIDRHLMGLKLIARENGLAIPTLYSDDGFVKSTNYRISTSQVASPNKVFMCYGPSVEDGYGICYNPRDNDMLLAVSSFPSCTSTSAVEMSKNLSDSLDAMYALLTRAGAQPASKL